jgi:NhaC family Na+:H+ antiporter
VSEPSEASVETAAVRHPSLELFGLAALDGPIQVAMIVCCAVAALIGLKTIWLIIGAVTFGALLEQLGLIDRIINPMIARATTRGPLYLTVFGCDFGLIVVAGDQYIALVLPSRMFRAEFVTRGLAPQNLSRLAADSATVTSPRVPWNSCAAFMGAVLGVSTLAYFPFAVFNIVSPLLSVGYGFTGFRILPASRRARRKVST